MSAVEEALGDAYREPAADVRGFAESVKTPAYTVLPSSPSGVVASPPETGRPHCGAVTNRGE